MALLEPYPGFVSAKYSHSTQADGRIAGFEQRITYDDKATVSEGKKGAVDRIQDKLEGTYWQALMKNWMVWPAVQAINFTVVPLDQRVLVVNVVALGWNCYLSYLNGQSDERSYAKDKKE